VNRSPVDDGTPWDAPALKGKCELSDRADSGDLTMVCDQARTVAKYLKDQRVIRIAQARRGLDQRIKYPLQIEGGPADNLQDIGRGRLLFPGLLSSLACAPVLPRTIACSRWR
jgi:hypothetical protein